MSCYGSAVKRPSPREAEAAKLAEQGLSSKEIAAIMGIGPNVARAYIRAANEKNGTTKLTPRQAEAANLASLGLEYEYIAAVMGISQQVVKNYMKVVFYKLGVSDRLELAVQMAHERKEAIDGVGDIQRSQADAHCAGNL